MISRDLLLFATKMKGATRESYWRYLATTAKRLTVAPPDGVEIYDTDLKKTFRGDGSTYGGISDTAKKSVRKIVVNAAASGGLSAASGTDKITWTTIGTYLRTGDAITVAAGTGTLPSGTSATTYWVVKDETNPDDASFRIATSRANSISGVPSVVDILSSGVPGWTAVINTVCVGGFEDTMLVDPVGAAVSVVLPDADSNDGREVLIKRAAAGSAITIKELTAAGAVAASGAVTIDDVVGYGSLASGSSSFGIKYFADADSSSWFTVATKTS